MRQADNSFTNHAAGKHVENSICMTCSKNPKIKVIKNESLNKLIYLSGAIFHMLYHAVPVIKTSQLAAKRPMYDSIIQQSLYSIIQNLQK